MKTVRTMLAMAAVLSIAAAMTAQEKRAGRGKGRTISPTARVFLRLGKLHSAVEGLDLTDEQDEKLEKIRKELGPKFAEAFGKHQEILTEEQRAASKEAYDKAKEAGKEGRALMLAVESSRKLTDEQKEKMTEVAKETWLPLAKDATKQVMGVLTPEQREKVRKAMAPQGRKPRKPDAAKAD